TETKRKENGNVIITKKNNDELINAEKEEKQLRKQVVEFANTDIYKAYDQEHKENKVVKSKYSDLVERFNENVNDYNELLEENRTLKSRVKDLTNEIGSIYKSANSFLK